MKPWLAWGAAVCLVACSKSSEVSLQKARAHARELVKITETDVGELRTGLPQGAKILGGAAQATADAGAAAQATADALSDAQTARRALDTARSKVQDLRVAKSTFFALVSKDGTVVRSDREQDLLAGKDLLSAFPDLRKALGGTRAETLGSMPELGGIAGGQDGQWVIAEPIAGAGGVQGLYVSGWSWSGYAYRLETALRSSVRSELGAEAKMPLLYVYVVVGSSVYGAPVAPKVNADAIAKQAPLSKLGADGSYGAELEITGRDFGLAVQRAPVFGGEVAIAVLRSET